MFLNSNGNSRYKITSRDSILVIDKVKDSPNNFTYIYYDSKGQISCKVISIYTVNTDTITKYVYDTSGVHLKNKMQIIGLYHRNTNEKLTVNSSIAYFDSKSKIYKIENLIVDTITLYAYNKINYIDRISVYDRRGREHINQVLAFNMIEIPFTGFRINEKQINLFINSKNDTLIKNGSGTYNDYNYHLSFYDMIYDDTFIVKGKVVNSLQDGDWVGKRADGQTYAVDHFENGKFIKGMSYDDSNHVYNYDIIFQNCIFGNCEKDLIDFLQKNIQYPAYEREADIEGRTLTKFTIDTVGLIKDVECVRHVSPGLDKEAKRVIELMHQWVPAVLRGQKKEIVYYLPVNFRLE